MGIWTWLYRMTPETVERGLRPFDENFIAGGLAVEQPPWRDQNAAARIDTHRAWHALHVLLTGSENDAEPPAAWVIYDGSTRFAYDFTSAVTLSSADDVIRIADYLRSASFDALIAERYPRLFKGDDSVSAYSFEGWGEDGKLDLVESGILRETFDKVRSFYLDAAAAGQAVVKARG
jgi:hypothetical protein